MTRSFYHDPENGQENTVQPCDHAGCDLPGLYPAPKSRQRLNERYHFCLEHVREYNKKWNFFEILGAKISLRTTLSKHLIEYNIELLE